jgi:hypothetical protein
VNAVRVDPLGVRRKKIGPAFAPARKVLPTLGRYAIARVRVDPYQGTDYAHTTPFKWAAHLFNASVFSGRYVARL